MGDITLVACHQCDLLHRLLPLPKGGVARCTRCRAVLTRHKPNSLERTLSLTIAGLILFVISNTYPFLAIRSEGLVRETTLMAGVTGLYAQDMQWLALLVFLTTILVPLTQLSGILYILLPLKLNRLPRMMPIIFRMLQKIQPWGMMEVFMLGILVSIVKLAKMAHIIPGISLISFVALIFVTAAMTVSLDSHLLWEKWDNRR